MRVAYAALGGAAIGILVHSALSLMVTGYRVDAEGTTPTDAEMIINWGGLAVALVLGAIAILGTVKGSGRPEGVVN